MKKTLIAVGIAIFAFCGIFYSCKKNSKPINYPQKKITVICPWGQGGGTDAILRALCKSAEKFLDVPVEVKNITGGAGGLGHAAIKDANTDGYTLGMITFELNSLPQQKLIDFTYKNIDPLIRVNTDAATLTVNKNAPYNTIQEFVDYCKANPGQVTIGNSAPGSVWNIAAGLFASEAKIDVRHFPFEGAAGAVEAVAGGHIDAITVSLPEVKTQLDAGKVKVLGIMTEKRLRSYPNIPTFKEQGYDLNFGTWRGLALPIGVNSQIKQILIDAFTKAEEDMEFKETALNLNLSLAYQNSDDFEKFLEQNFTDTASTMQAIGLTH